MLSDLIKTSLHSDDRHRATHTRAASQGRSMSERQSSLACWAVLWPGCSAERLLASRLTQRLFNTHHSVAPLQQNSKYAAASATPAAWPGPQSPGGPTHRLLRAAGIAAAALHFTCTASILH